MSQEPGGGGFSGLPDRAGAIHRYLAVRADTEQLASPLSEEDQLLQSSPLCSPTKWHRAHTTWFFETFLLEPRGIAPIDPRYRFLFNSYYDAVGPRHARPKRGLLSRPTASEVASYRRTVDGRMVELLSSLDDVELGALLPALELGLAHEEQHQELMLTDILHAFHENPLLPAYRAGTSKAGAAATSAALDGATPDHLFAGGLIEIGASSRGAFAFDNEGPRHKVWLEPFQLARRLVTVGEMKAFIQAGGYRTPSLWLSEGYEWATARQIDAPCYWHHSGPDWLIFGLDGLRELPDNEPVSHVSYYEADAVARFLGGRLPSEQEWEAAASHVRSAGNFVSSSALRPLAARVETDGPTQMFGDVWEWTRSSYEPYPGYRPAAGAFGEYNGKFMVNQRVLRGGSCFTPDGHVRSTYRNFWHPDTRFQVTGIRVAKDA